MIKTFLKSPAKINLSLKIGKKINHKYHDIQSVIFLINLHDKITIKKLQKKIYLNLQENLKKILNLKITLYQKVCIVLRKKYISVIAQSYEIKVKKIYLCFLGSGRLK